MPTHAEQRHLPYSQKQLFDLVASVERYPEFLPWCSAARITRREGNRFHADLIVRFKMFQERFGSKVTLHPHELIDVEYINGPFRYLNNHWRFIEAEDGGCIIDFYVDFEFKSKMLQKLIGLLFNEAVSRMVGAFETRARELYGDRPQPRRAPRPPVPAGGAGLKPAPSTHVRLLGKQVCVQTRPAESGLVAAGRASARPDRSGPRPASRRRCAVAAQPGARR